MSEKAKQEELKQKIYDIITDPSEISTANNVKEIEHLINQQVLQALERVKSKKQIFEAVSKYHDEITDHEKKVWLYKEDFAKRIALVELKARRDESKMYYNALQNALLREPSSIGLSTFSNRIAELTKAIKEMEK